MSYAKLRGAIRERFGTQKAFAAAIGLNPGTLSNKLGNKSDWTRQEIEDACRLLDISANEAHEYFFTR